MNRKEIKNKVVKGLLWTYAERMLAQFISLAVTVVLARMLSPSVYGMISIVTIFINFADTFAVNGLGNSLIQKKDADELDFSSVFFFNLVFSSFIYLLLFLSAGPISVFYDITELELVLKVMAVRIPIAAVNSVQQAYVSKKMEFRKFFFSSLGGTVFSAFAGISMAYLGFGVWALAAQYLSNAVIDTCVLWFASGWRPSFQYSNTRMKSLFSYGWKVLAGSLLISIYGDIQNLVIGKKFSSKDLAFSEKGRQFPALIAANINTSISKVLFPAVSASQNKTKEVKAMTRRAVSAGTYLLAPVLSGLAAAAENIVRIVLTDKWIPCVPYLRIMCMIFLLQPIQTAGIQAMKALGESGLYLKLEIIKKIAGTVVLLCSVFLFDSVLAIIWGSLISEMISAAVNFPANKRLINYTYIEQFEDIIQTVLISIVMVLAVRMADDIFISPGLSLAAQAVTGVAVYIGLSAILKNKDYRYVKMTAAEAMKSIHKKKEGFV